MLTIFATDCTDSFFAFLGKPVVKKPLSEFLFRLDQCQGGRRAGRASKLSAAREALAFVSADIHSGVPDARLAIDILRTHFCVRKVFACVDCR